VHNRGNGGLGKALDAKQSTSFYTSSMLFSSNLRNLHSIYHFLISLHINLRNFVIDLV
jgi:hypothetical protein